MVPKPASKIEPIKAGKIPEVDVNAPLKVEKVLTPDSAQEENKAKRLYFVGVGVFVVLIAAIALLLILMPFVVKQDGDLVVKPVASDEVVGESEQKEEVINRAEWNFEILNGSGVSGAAKKAADVLSAKGYKVVKTGNAVEEVGGSEIYISESLVSRKDLLLADLEADFPGIVYKGQLEGASASARLVLGPR